ncbi:MAG TPA: glycosyltransferase [Acidimicrobiales bacterium]|nr:glycosyltransferase [Acidimicrobiales bacterium]
MSLTPTPELEPMTDIELAAVAAQPESSPPNVDQQERAAAQEPLLQAGTAFRPVKVLDLDLEQPLVDLDGLYGYGAVQLLVRLHGIPLGYARLPLTNGRVSATALRKGVLAEVQVRAVRHLLNDYLGVAHTSGPGSARQLVGVAHPQDDLALPSVTVAVCTRDRTEVLERCLRAIEKIDYPGLEVLVVDNAPATDATRRLVAEQFPQLRYVVEPLPGLDRARNRAISESGNDIVAFTDDDVVVDPLWVGALARPFAESDRVMCVTGLVVAYELETEAQVLFEKYGGFGRGFDRHWYTVDPDIRETLPPHVGAGRFGTGANMAYRRCVFEEIGQFDPALDVGTVTNGGGDLEMFFRLLEEGHTLVYEPAAIVRHGHRREYAALRTQLANNGIGFYSMLVRSAIAYPIRRRAIVRLGLWWLWHWSFRRLLISFLRPGRFPRDLILAELKGSIVGVARYQRSRRQAARLDRGRRPSKQPAAPGAT